MEFKQTLPVVVFCLKRDGKCKELGIIANIYLISY